MKIIDVAFLKISPGDTDLLTKISRGRNALVVSPDDDALSVARKLDYGKFPLAIVKDPLKGYVGVFSGRSAKIKIGKHKKVDLVVSVEEALTLLVNDPIEQARNFHHEWLNFERPVFFWCERGKHATDEPCDLQH